MILLRTVVLSDLHIGYKHSDSMALGGFVESLIADRPDRLVLLGDIFDFWRCSDTDLLIKHQSIVERLLQLPISYVHGNHDYSIMKLSRRFPEEPAFEVKTVLTLRNKNARFILRHGYDLEVFASMEIIGLEAYETFSEAMCHAGEVGGTIAGWVWSVVELARGRLGPTARSLLRAVVSKPAETRSTFEKVDQLAKSPSRTILLGMRPDDILVFGHTHRPFRDPRTINTGSWVMTKDKKEHTYLEITDDSFELKAWPVSDKATKTFIRRKAKITRPQRKEKKKS